MGGWPVAGQAGVTSPGAARWRLGSLVAALMLGGLVLVLAAGAEPLARLAHQSLNASTGSTPVWVSAPAGLVGFVVAWRKPGNSLGWIILVAAVLSMLTKDASYYAVADYRLHHGGLPLGWVSLLAQPGSVLGLVLLGLVFLLFPDGRPPSRRWRWVLWVYAGTGLVWTTWTAAITVGAVIGHHTQVNSAGQLFQLTGQDPAAGLWNAALSLFILLVAVCLVASLAGQVASWRQSSGERRQQLKWLMASGPTWPARCSRPWSPLTSRSGSKAPNHLVGVAGFEPAASSSRTKRAAKLRYTPPPMPSL
jgi:hypothetical protein